MNGKASTPPKRQLAPRWVCNIPRTDRSVAGRLALSLRSALTLTSLVLVTSLPLGEQLLGGIGLALQPGQARLLVHPGDRFAGRQPLAHDRDDLAVGCRLLLQHPAG